MSEKNKKNNNHYKKGNLEKIRENQNNNDSKKVKIQTLSCVFTFASDCKSNSMTSTCPFLHA